MPRQVEDRFAILYEIGRKLSSSLELAVVLELTLDSLIEVMGAERGFIMLAEPASPDGAPELVVKVARNLDRQTLEAEAFRISRTLTQQVFDSRQPALITDAQSDASLSRAASVAAFQLRSILCAPLQVKGRPIGVVYVDNRLRSGLFGEADRDLLVAFADQAAAALDNARLYEDLRQQMRQVAQLKEYQDNIFRSVGSAVLTIDLEGRITTFNRAAELVFGRPAEQALGRSHAEVLGPALAERLFRPIMRASRPGGQPISGLEIVCPLGDRERAFLSLSLTALRDPDGQPLGVVLVADDHTEARLAEEAEREIRDVFGRYVARGVVDRLLAHRGEIHLGGEEQEITVLFGDIRGYTTLSEGLSPQQVVGMLNGYLAVATRAIFREEGTLDKYIGDAVMALFNAPLPQPDHALAALRAALGMQRDLKQLAAEANLPVAYGVGINTGPAVVGNIGTEQLMNYTAIGDAVNVAARLQSSVPAGEVWFSESTYALVEGRVEAVRGELLTVKGRRQPVQVYRLIAV
jgi:adenylate cyclase